jgi:acetyl esterase/lipase
MSAIPLELKYGLTDEQYLVVYRPSITCEQLEKRPVVYIIHGGYWRQQYNINNALIHTLPAFFSEKGWWTVMLEYRRGNYSIDGGNGGWPETNEDVLLGLSFLQEAAQNTEVGVSHIYIFKLFNSRYYALKLVCINGSRKISYSWSFSR